jgi:glycerol-3-phosphate dehydrogenase
LQPPAISALERERTLAALEGETFDVLVIGGGITGAGVAREASRRGLSVCLFEAADFAAGTSSRSSKLIHGGLRYLAMGDVALVRESALERKEVHRLAPHLAEPRWMLLPVRSRAGLMRFRVAISTYEKLGAVAESDLHQNWDVDELARREPALDRAKYRFACAYREYLTDDARLVLANCRDAAGCGAVLVNHAPVVELLLERGRMCGVVAECALSGARVAARARCVINAAGPWVEAVRRLETPHAPPWLHLSSGIHVGVPAHRLPVHNMVMLTASDRRTVFAIHRGGITYVGTTERSYPQGPALWPRIEREDVEYLLEPVARSFTAGPLGPDAVVTAWAGIRPLVAEPGKAPAEISRKDEIVIGASGLISIAGGKLTGYRPMARAALGRAAQVMGSALPEPREDPPLPGGGFEGEVSALAGELGRSRRIAPRDADRLVRLYGAETERVLAHDPDLLFAPLGIRGGEVDWAVRFEGALTLEDLVYRRLRIALFEHEGREDCLDALAARMGSLLDWDEARREAEVAGVRTRLRDDLAFRSAAA